MRDLNKSKPPLLCLLLDVKHKYLSTTDIVFILNVPCGKFELSTVLLQCQCSLSVLVMNVSLHML